MTSTLLHPGLFTHYWLGSADVLRHPIAWGSFGDNALPQFDYIAVLDSLVYGCFRTNDILS